jgi:hypothetical protein
VKTPKELQALLPPLRALQNLIDRFEGQGIIIGGVAVSLLSEPRYTADVDAVIFLSIRDLPRLLSAANEEGFEPRIPNVKAAARASRVVLLRYRGTKITADISLGALPFEREAIERSRLLNIGKTKLRIPSVEDLIVMKAIAHRPKDLLDIQSLIDANPKLDRGRIKNWVRQYADLLEMPELWTDLEPLLRTKRKS